jgi:cation diffusion facilitator CzcD-associated flavoprotein CzcO
VDDTDTRSRHNDPEHAPIRRDVVVIGAGQAGLAVGYFLSQQGVKFTILDAADTPGAAWCARWASLRLCTPARYSSLPVRPTATSPSGRCSRCHTVVRIVGLSDHVCAVRASAPQHRGPQLRSNIATCGPPTQARTDR